MSLIWMPPRTSVPPGTSARSAAGTRVPSGAKMIAPSSGSGGASCESPAYAAPSRSANSRAASSPGRTNANTRRPSTLATWARMCAAAPKPYSPSRGASPHMRSAR